MIEQIVNANLKKPEFIQLYEYLNDNQWEAISKVFSYTSIVLYENLRGNTASDFFWYFSSSLDILLRSIERNRHWGIEHLRELSFCMILDFRAGIVTKFSVDYLISKSPYLKRVWEQTILKKYRSGRDYPYHIKKLGYWEDVELEPPKLPLPIVVEVKTVEED